MERNEILLLANKIEKQLKHFRHELHKRAELSMQEFKTASYIRRVITENDIEFKEVDTGTIVDINNNLKGSVLALRADIDALPITEPKTFEFRLHARMWT